MCLLDGSRVDQTQSAIVLESLINKLFAGFADKGGSAQGNGQNGTNNQSDTNSQQGTKK